MVVDWIQLAQDRDQWWVLLNIVTNLRIAYSANNFCSNFVTISFLRLTRFH
jgi:hypothetical protein